MTSSAGRMGAVVATGGAGGWLDRDGPAALWLPNLLLLALIAIVVLSATCGASRRVEELVVTDDRTRVRIHELERRLRHGWGGGGEVIELARLYRRAGAFPWSYDALRSAETHGPGDSGWRLKLGLAYIELGRNADGQRVIKQTLEACEAAECGPHVRARLSLFLRVAQLMVERKIDARYDVTRANEVFQEVLKPAESTGLAPPPAEPAQGGPGPSEGAAGEIPPPRATSRPSGTGR